MSEPADEDGRVTLRLRSGRRTELRFGSFDPIEIDYDSVTNRIYLEANVDLTIDDALEVVSELQRAINGALGLHSERTPRPRASPLRFRLFAMRGRRSRFSLIGDGAEPSG